MTSKNKSLVKPSLRFRPQNVSGSFIMKERLQTGKSFNYNYQERTRWYPSGWGFSKKVLGRIFGQLHYRACHAPKPIQKQWASAYKAFGRKYMPINASVRYIKQREWL
jgi:hypothetical protein